MNSHSSQAELLSLLHGTLAGGDAAYVFGHLADCDACATRMRALRAILEDPDSAWNGFTERLRSNPGSAQHRPPVGTFQLLIDGGRHLAALADGIFTGLESAMGLQTTAVPVRAGIGHPGDEAKVQRLVDEATHLLFDGEFEEARELLSDVAKIAPDAATRSARTLTREGRPFADLVVDAQRGSISLLLHAAETTEERERFRAVLLAADGRVAREAEFARVEGAQYLLAEFEQVESGHWTLRLEFPTAAAGDH